MIKLVKGGLRTAPFLYKNIGGKGKIMITMNVNEKEYKLKFGFDAAEEKNIVQRMFNIVSGAYILKGGNDLTKAVFEGTGDMISDIPQTCIEAIFAGCLEENPVTMDEAKTLSRTYITEKRKSDKKYSYRSLFDELKKAMEDDGFFDLSGINEMVEEMTTNAEKSISITK
jgi:hypothetical protein